MKFETIAILNDEIPSYRVRSAGAFQFTDYETKQVKIIAPIDKAAKAIQTLFPYIDLVNIFDKFYFITPKGKVEITEYEFNQLKRQMIRGNGN